MVRIYACMCYGMFDGDALQHWNQHGTEMTGVLRNIIPAHGATANVLNYSAASVVCAVCKDWEKVLGVFEEMREKRISPNAACLTDLVVVSAKTGQWEELLEARQSIF